MSVNQRMAGDAFSGGSFYNKNDEEANKKFLDGSYGVKDSPFLSSQFVGQHQGMNRVAQRKYEDAGRRTANKYAGYRGGDTNLEALQSRIDRTSLLLKDQATIQEVKTYGDRAAKMDYKPFEFGDPIQEVKSKADKIAKDYKKELD